MKAEHKTIFTINREREREFPWKLPLDRF